MGNFGVVTEENLSTSAPKSRPNLHSADFSLCPMWLFQQLEISVFFSGEAAGTAKERSTFFLNYFAPYMTGSFTYKSVSPGLGVICAADS